MNQHFSATALTSVGRRLGGLLTIPNWWYIWLVASAPTRLPSPHYSAFSVARLPSGFTRPFWWNYGHIVVVDYYLCLYFLPVDCD